MFLIIQCIYEYYRNWLTCRYGFSAKILQVVFGHYDVVTVVGRSECNVNQDCYVVTGAKDCSVMVWMFNAKSQAILGDNGSKCFVGFSVFHNKMLLLIWLLGSKRMHKCWVV